MVGESNKGISLFPKSPVNTVLVSFPSSFVHNSITLEPNICPASLNLTWISSVISIISSYCTGSKISNDLAASSAVYKGSTSFSPFLFPPGFPHTRQNHRCRTRVPDRHSLRRCPDGSSSPTPARRTPPVRIPGPPGRTAPPP